MVPLSEQKVQAAYEAGYECVRRQDAYVVAVEKVGFEHRVNQPGPEVVEPPRSALRRLDGLLADLREAVEAGAKALEELGHHPAAVSPGIEKAGFVHGSSWLELCVLSAEWLLSSTPPWAKYCRGEDGNRWGRRRNLLQHLVPGAQAMAGLKIEEARLRDRAVALSSDERYGWVMQQLEGQSRRRFEYFAKREGRVVGAEELAEYLWRGEPDVSQNRIQQAVYKLRYELKAAGVPNLAADLQTVRGDGGYRFR